MKGADDEVLGYNYGSPSTTSSSEVYSMKKSFSSVTLVLVEVVSQKITYLLNGLSNLVSIQCSKMRFPS